LSLPTHDLFFYLFVPFFLKRAKRGKTLKQLTNVKEILEAQIQKEYSSKMNTPHPELHADENKISVVSLFCGAGGLDLGLEWAGIEKGLGRSVNIYDYEEYRKVKKFNVFQTVYATDFFKEAVETYQMNFKETVTQLADIRELSQFPKASVYTFGFPCPGFVRPDRTA
jgi:DNA (cytosine-5)-methyltransferase 1